jgi:hypothetical protein
VLIPLAIIGAISTVREDLIGSENPIYRVAYWLPGWQWQTYALIWAILMIALILESSYRAIKKRDDLMHGVFAPEKTIARLIELQDEGMRVYYDTNHAPNEYINNLEQWEATVANVIRENYSEAELHSFNSYIFASGGEYTLDAVSDDWKAATHSQRVKCTSRIMAINRTIDSGSMQFFGPRRKLAEWLNCHNN